MRQQFFAFILVVAIGLLAFALPSMAKSKNKGGNSQFRTRASLTKCCGNPVLGIDGHVDFKTKTKKGQLDSVDLKVRVEADANPNLPPGPLDVRLILNNGTADYAECLLVADDDEGEVEFKLDLRQKRGNFEEKRGSCDLSLTTPGAQRGIPAIKVADIAIVTVVRDPQDRTKDIDFLMGVFD